MTRMQAMFQWPWSGGVVGSGQASSISNQRVIDKNQEFLKMAHNLRPPGQIRICKLKVCKIESLQILVSGMRTTDHMESVYIKFLPSFRTKKQVFFKWIIILTILEKTTVPLLKQMTFQVSDFFGRELHHT